MEPGSGEKKKVEVTILNQTFTLLTTGDPREMIDLAQQVDDLMTGVAKRSPNLDATRVAVLACLQLADELRSRQSALEGKMREFTGLLEKVLEEE